MMPAALTSRRARARSLWTMALALAAGIAVPGIASAADDYAGTWALDLANCKTPQSRQDAPLILTAKGYDRHETHCRFTSLKSAGAGEWAGSAQCSVEGDTQTVDVRLTVSGKTLTLSEDGANRDLLRCP